MLSNKLQYTYRPATPLARATMRLSPSRIALISCEEPGNICGKAFRVGYCGKQPDDLALYRLKVSGVGRAKNGRETTTLPGFFILDRGIFSPVP